MLLHLLTSFLNFSAIETHSENQSFICDDESAFMQLSIGSQFHSNYNLKLSKNRRHQNKLTFGDLAFTLFDCLIIGEYLGIISAQVCSHTQWL